MKVRTDDKIFVTGHKGLLGSAICAELRAQGFDNLVTVSRQELDLRDSVATAQFLDTQKPKAIIHCAALVGGIQANLARPADFLRDNLLVQNSVIHGSHLANVDTLLFFGSNCMYPTSANQPMTEKDLLQGPIETSNLAYGAAKIAGYIQCQSYFKQYGRNYYTVIPASLYGPNDNYDVNQCHVTPALLIRFHLAKKIQEPSFSVWGTGKPRRELLYSADAAQGVMLLLEKWDASKGPINLGAGDDLSIEEIAHSIKDVVGFKGNLIFDKSKPDGTYRKLLNSARAQEIGFRPSTTLKEGLKKTYEWLLGSKHIRGLKPGDI